MNKPEFNSEVAAMRDSMYRFARSLLLDSAEAEDVVHDLLERLWVRRDRLDGCRSIEAFVMISVRNACYDRLRRRAAAPKPAQRPQVFVDDADRRDVRELVRCAMAHLPARQREMLHLKDIEGYPTRELAEMYGCDEGTVRMTLTRARRGLKTVIEEMMR